SVYLPRARGPPFDRTSRSPAPRWIGSMGSPRSSSRFHGGTRTSDLSSWPCARSPPSPQLATKPWPRWWTRSPRKGSAGRADSAGGEVPPQQQEQHDLGGDRAKSHGGRMAKEPRAPPRERDWLQAVGEPGHH